MDENGDQLTNAETRTRTLKDGRILAYCEYGDSKGVPVFYAHGGPGSRLEAALFDDCASRHGFRLIATDRPGMGRSTYKPGRTLLDYPRDLAELADILDIDRFGVMGMSGGGAHTVVCAYAQADRLLFNIALCGYTNFAELPGAEKMLPTKADQIFVGLSKKYPRLFGAFFEIMAFAIKYFPNALYKELLNIGNATDKQVCQDQNFKSHFIKDQKEAFIQGGKGVALDSAIHYLDWGFLLKDIPGRVIIMHGTEDNLVPYTFAEHLAENIPNAELHLLEGEGHLFPVPHQDLIFEIAKKELAGN